ncbi:MULTISPECIES: type 1 glutamine amidotransferase [unclassified Gilliamella]|uniref:type 1 glutamine amidotransferase n=1 Tax=unclassified Gilliamella TaxID=2685620 RepID=UPI00226A3608|nr:MULTISPECIES: type 1 glutamine amidotransferase [unclassified Gilliamella]MCX8574327.1 type 1 glutamine amidotransferase [Gilliamella sp. B3831]MCX8576558.1 type 1 glutamine amidotransferase [Gilliamella sp. B3815]MCX8590872.1 type 1 glutamine amidotransferase [Gilliamella sp. B3812]MCX8603555.1 type 1 glutamine amidotransferase [Gilliamella sp. B3823]MCX8605947.1 type 1 glutamine amidotransferase [Gilliamella sp. B3825]
MHIHFILHEEFEAPGAYEQWAKLHLHTVTYSRVYLGEPLSERIDNIDFLIIMGGPQSPATTKQECAHFDSLAEQTFILSAIKANKIVIGVCLGSQLIGEALGAHFEHSPEKEIGKFPITLTEAGKKNPLFSHFGDTLAVGHWHNDMPGLTQNAQIIAYSEGCPRQIIAYIKLVYGFQCHMELTHEVVEKLIAHSQNDLSQAAKYRFVDTEEKLRLHDYSKMNYKLFVFLDKLSQYYLSASTN